MSDKWKIRFRLSKSITVRPILIASDVTPRKVSSRTNVVVGTAEVVVAATVVEVGAVVVAGGTVVEVAVVGATVVGPTVVGAIVVGVAVVGTAEVVIAATVVELGAIVLAGTAVVGATVVVDTAATSTGDAGPPCPQAVAPTKTAVRIARVARGSGRIGTRGHGARTGCLVQDVGPAVGWQAAADPGTYPAVSPHDHEVREAPQAVRLGHL